MNIEKTVYGILETECCLDPDEIKSESVLIDDLGLDSIDFVEVALYLEEAFNINIEPDEIFNTRTVEALVDLTCRKVRYV